MKIAIVNCFNTYEHRVDMLMKYFLDRGHSAEVYTAGFDHRRKVPRQEAREHFEYVPVRPYRRNLSVDRIRSHIGFAREVYRRIADKEYDLLWIIVPPNSDVKQLIRYKQEHDCKIVFDIFDLWPETMPVPAGIKWMLPFRVWAAARDSYLEKCDCLVGECRLFLQKLNAGLPDEKQQVLYLARQYPDCYEAVAEEEVQEGISLCYLGSINNIIDIDAICAILTAIQKHCPAVLHIVGDGERSDEFLQRTKATGAEVIFHGPVYDTAAKQRILSCCDYGLNIMKDSVMVGLTMKSMDYFENGLPLINNIKGDTWDFCRQEQVGINYPVPDWEERVLRKDIRREKVFAFGKANFSEEKFAQRMDVICGEIAGKRG